MHTPDRRFTRYRFAVQLDGERVVVWLERDQLSRSQRSATTAAMRKLADNLTQHAHALAAQRADVDRW